MKPALLIPALTLALGAHALAGDSIAVRAQRLYTMAGPPIEGGVVWIEDGKIRAVGPADEVALPEDVEVREAVVATPGLVDARTSLGLAGWLNVPHDRDEVDRSGPVQPELRAVDAYDARSPLIEWVRAFGVTTVHTGHAPLALISGQTMVAKLRGDTVEEAVLVPEAMISCTLGAEAREGKGAPGTSARTAATLRAELLAAQEYAAKRARAEDDDEQEPPARDLRKEALARVLDGETPLLVHAQTTRELMTALRVAGEFPGIELVIEGAAEAPLVLEELLAAEVPVFLHPSMGRPIGETKALSYETAKVLREAGVPLALESGYEGYVPRARNVLFEAAIAARYGLGFEEALALVTRESARLLGVLDRVGTLEVGKDGDVALYDGDPFEYTTHCLGVLIDGRPYLGEGELQARRESR
jgi:imidazolonepropionase-like amidohydrolase